MYISASLQAYKVNDTSNFSITTLNNVSWINPGVDVLQAYYYNLSGFYTDDFPDNPLTFYDFVAFDLGPNTIFASLGRKVNVLEYGEEVEMVFQSANVLNASVDHPMHLHGHSFYVIGLGAGDFDFVKDRKTYNLFDPPKLNTATIQKSGWLAIRFKATNPGVWLLHCHVERHYSWGMNTVFIVKNRGTPETIIRGPPPNMPIGDDPFSINLKGFNDSAFYPEYRAL